MPKFKVFEAGSIGSIGIEVEVGYHQEITSKQTLEVTSLLIKVLSGDIGKRLNVGFNLLYSSQSELKLNIVFTGKSSSRVDMKNDQTIIGEQLGRVRANFVFYLFTLIDDVAKLGDIPFPPNFRYFANLPETLQREYGWI